MCLHSSLNANKLHEQTHSNRNLFVMLPVTQAMLQIYSRRKLHFNRNNHFACTLLDCLYYVRICTLYGVHIYMCACILHISVVDTKLRPLRFRTSNSKYNFRWWIGICSTFYLSKQVSLTGATICKKKIKNCFWLYITLVNFFFNWNT